MLKDKLLGYAKNNIIPETGTVPNEAARFSKNPVRMPEEIDRIFQHVDEITSVGPDVLEGK